MISKSYDIVPSYVQLAGDVGDKFIGVDGVWSVSRAPRLALTLVPNGACLSGDLPPAADVNAVFAAPGDLEAAA